MPEQNIEASDELLTRFEMVESMVREGRRRTEYWGWTQVLWGAAYLIAIGWSAWSRKPNIAWPVTMIAAVVTTILFAGTRKREHNQTTISRALRAIWTSMGIAIFLYCFSIGLSGHFEIHILFAAAEAFLGLANFASAMILRWRIQFFVAIVWWASAIATCFVGETLVIPILVAATLIGMIGFGLYLMYSERRDRRVMVQHA
jgi:hypothetical protein